MLNKNDAAATRYRINDGAMDALQKNGLPPLSYDAIAAEIGASRQLVRYHFPEVDDLMLAVCDRLALAYRQLLVENAARLDGPGRLDMFLDFYFNLLDGAAKPRDDIAYDAMMTLSATSPSVRRNLRKQYTLLGQVISHEIHTAHPAMPAASADELAYVFVSLMYGHWKMVASLGVSEAHNRVSRAAMDRLIRSYGENDAPIENVGRIWAPQG